MMNADDLQCTAQGCCNTAQSYGLCASHLSRVQTRDLSQTSFMDAGQNTSLRTSPTTHHRPQGLTSSAHYDTPTSIQSGSENSDDGGGQHDSVVRRERNRIAARKSRQRKLDKIQHLENEKGRLEGHRNRLINEIRMLESRMEGSLGTTKKVLTDDEYEALQNERVRVIEDVHAMYNARNIEDSTKYFREDSIVSGPQNSVHLRGKDAIVLDFLCTDSLFENFQLNHTKIDSGGPRSQHFRVYWLFTGTIKATGSCMNKEFQDLFGKVQGKTLTIDGVSNYSFSGDKIVYIHRTADQAKLLSTLVKLSKV
ncbi:hypothetical protein H310_02829 [Aphanomyces invadans]|uniref:BZIP domain-containing protein n=2 Tax=Aphanomyces invadans TaxID=157072 RepID=A0A024UL95_9STRA|nr:hypothetical protein H310_02829 [Aphanomyces invadans]ETW06637.1 hypothetical protein H310_02829 [Aphanomyces invadans]|eukprot:XP_008864712.1 hypothetical protein H310_02829 [Aphanomyces invadans]